MTWQGATFSHNRQRLPAWLRDHFACYLHNRLEISKRTFLIEQGRIMPEPSPCILHLRLKIDHNVISGLLTGDNAAVRKVGSIDIWGLPKTRPTDIKSVLATGYRDWLKISSGM